MRIVGWYKDATVFRAPQEFIKPLPCQTQQKPTKVDRFRIKAHKDNSQLLPVEDRDLEIPRGEGWMGHNLIWYADDSKFEERQSEFKERVSKYIREYELSSAINQRWGGTPEQRKKVEKEAIKKCEAHFEQEGYEVCSFESDKVGWDLGAWKFEPQKRKDLEREANEYGGMSLCDYLREQYLQNRDFPEQNPYPPDLRIEVKGLSGSDPSIVLTPNEYEAFNRRESNYRLALVVNALDPDKQKLIICHYNKEHKEHGDWLVERIGSKETLSLSAEDKIFGSVKIKTE